MKKIFLEITQIKILKSEKMYNKSTKLFVLGNYEH